MVSSKFLLAITSLALFNQASAAAVPNSAPQSHCQDVCSPTFHQNYVNKWLKFWDGDFSLLDQVVSPDMVMYADRVPSPSGNGSQFFPVTSSKVFLQVVQQTLSAYSKYSFQLRGWAGTDNILAVRWTLNGVLGSSSKKAGATTSINGTDFIFLDKCTGLLKEYDLATDSINRFHEMGLTSVSV